MSTCTKCGVFVKATYGMKRHQNTFKCIITEKDLIIEKTKKKIRKYKKYKDNYKLLEEKYKELQKMYEQVLDKGMSKPTNITNITDKSTKTTNQYLNLQGYTLDALKDKMNTFPVLNYGNGRKASEQVARFVAENVRGDNNELTVICTDQERQKFYCLEDDKWIEDVSNQKTVSGVCQCIKEHFGDEQTFINKLVEKRKQELQDETARMLQGIENENDLQRDLLSYKSKVATTVSQIIACSGGGENDFSKGYLKKLSTLVRGTKSQRKEVKKMLK